MTTCETAKLRESGIKGQVRESRESFLEEAALELEARG